MAKQSRSKKGSRKTRVAKASPSKTTRKAAKTPRKVKGASSPSEPRKAVRARKPRPPKPAEVYGHDAPYNCDDPFMKEPVRLRVCRPDPKKPGRRKCDQRAFVVEGCATPGPGRRAKQMFVVPHTHQYLAPRREVARAKEMPLLDNGDCADARFAHSRGQQIPKSAYDQCRISVDSSTVSLPNGYGRARGMAARGSRHNPPLLVPGRDYRWHSGHGGSGIVTYLGGDGRVARVSMNGSVFGVPTRELLPMGADIGVGYPMTRPNAADADAVLSSPTFLPPPKSDPYMGKRVFGKNVQGMVRGVARCGENGPRMYVVGGQIVSRARVASALRKEQRERDIAEGRMPAPSPRARPRKPEVVAAPPREALTPMVPRIDPSRIIDVQAEEVVRVPRAAAESAAVGDDRLRVAVSEAIKMFMGRTPPAGTVNALASAIETGTYNDLLDPMNRNSRAAFEYLTGVKLPKGIGATRGVFRGRPFPVVV